MKLLFCSRCEDVRKIGYEPTYCRCGHSYGFYKEDGIHAVYAGDAVPLGIITSDLFNAIGMRHIHSKYGPRFGAFVIPDCSEHIEFIKE